MPYPPQTKQLAQLLDIECWRSYSGKPVEVKRALDVRRSAALRDAQETIDEIFAECTQPERDNPMPDGKKHFFEFVLDADELRALDHDQPPHGFAPWSLFDHVDPELPIAAPPKRYHAQVMKIEMMLHFATIAGPFIPEAQRTSSAYTKFVTQLLADDLIERPTEEEREEYQGWAYRATERGLAYVEGLKDVQLPVPVETSTTWIIPE